jgi:hypothetical protein
VDTILSILNQIDWAQFGGWGLIVAGILGLFRKQVAAALPMVKGLLPSGDEDFADLKAVKQLEARAERRGCKKLKDAVVGVQTCFFNKAEPVKVEA